MLQAIRGQLKNLSALSTLLLLFAIVASAGQPVIWETSGRADLLKGDARGISISDTGMLMLAPKLTEIFNTEQAFVWSSTVDAQGNELQPSESVGHLRMRGGISEQKAFGRIGCAAIHATMIAGDSIELPEFGQV